jgi:NAD(P)-dependent dehydrogenase (short-subunit alcohol dehydrogenase family)
VKDFQGRVAVITGAASGIGLALANEAAAQGMKLAVADIDDAALAAAAGDLRAQGAEVLTVPTDVRDPKAVDDLRDATLSAHGAIHLVCNNAGVGGGGRSWEAPLEMWRWVIDVDLWSVIHGVRTFVPVLLEQGEGHVVNTASAAGLTAVPGMGPYTVAKHGVVALTETLAQELAGTGVGASVLCPSFVRTRIHEVERHAPADLLERWGPRDTPEAETGRQFMKSMIDAGIDPAEVARKVFTAVQAGRVHILTHPESRQWVEARLQAILDDYDAS